MQRYTSFKSALYKIRYIVFEAQLFLINIYSLKYIFEGFQILFNELTNTNRQINLKRRAQNRAVLLLMTFTTTKSW